MLRTFLIPPGHRTSKYLRTLKSVAWMLRWHRSTGNSQAILSLEELNCAKTVVSFETPLVFCTFPVFAPLRVTVHLFHFK